MQISSRSLVVLVSALAIGVAGAISSPVVAQSKSKSSSSSTKGKSTSKRSTSRSTAKKSTSKSDSSKSSGSKSSTSKRSTSRSKSSAKKKVYHRLPSYFGKLELKDAQRTEIYEIQDEYGPEIDKLKKELATLREKQQQEVEDVLTATQKKRLASLRDARKKTAAR